MTRVGDGVEGKRESAWRCAGHAGFQDEDEPTPFLVAAQPRYVVRCAFFARMPGLKQDFAFGGVGHTGPHQLVEQGLRDLEIGHE